jgi:neutral ceramidase
MSQNKLWASVAHRVITPIIGSKLAGFDARTGVASGIHDDLYVRALVIGNSDKSVAIATFDLLGISMETTTAVRRAVHQKTGMAEPDIVLSATHTHCGPVTIQHFFNPDQGLDNEYMRKLEGLAIEAICEAFEKREPAVIKTGLVPVSGVAVNRRTESGKPVDEYAGVLVAQDEAGHTKAIYVSYSCHPTVLGPDTLEVTRDFPHYFVECLTKHFGKDTVAIYANGAEGDTSVGHKSYLSAVGVIAPNRTFEKAKDLGTRLAQSVIDCLDKLTEETGPFESFHSIIQLPLKAYPPHAQMLGRKQAALKALDTLTEGSSQNDVIACRQEWLFARIEEYYSSLYEKAADTPFLSAEVTVIRIGETALVALAGEVFVEIGLGIRGDSPFERTIIVGLANNYIGYIPTVEQAKQGGYEVVASRVTPEASLVLKKGAVDLLKEAHALDGEQLR